ncbi:MAG: methylenetetrahydrofolate--tRNA-(uracil(54)-C(5))-methyltransferase (FADH(2)-oxidizing) TrmFO [Clostridia bacterium]|nr:methylenetetrahydrofolate--tRNA-(uracil(54)-C(5))-methyltransferase (FADH(2)-oxidizing) TrmFO [Clostridia bacterium]
MQKVNIIGAGLAGCESALQLAKRGVSVNLYEMKPSKFTPAHKNKDFAELVCSNSLKSDTLEFATGLLKAELRLLDCELLKIADECAIPSGKTLTVNRELFASKVTQKIKEQPLINIIEQEVTSFDITQPTIISAGPLCTEELSNFLSEFIGDKMYFYDAVAPIVSADSLDYKKAYDGDEGYINCPLTKEEYFEFWSALKDAQRVELHDFEKEINFEACLPIEIMAKRGLEVMRCGPMKAGLKDNGAYAVVQLRKENEEGTMLNLVGFQTNLTFPEQKRVFSLIPALRNAEWLRYGVMHKNTYINAPKLLNKYSQLKTNPNIFFAGQISGLEGYIESISSGLLCGINMLKYISNLPLCDFGTETCLGALQNYLLCGNINNFQPMHINWGLLKPIDAPKKDKKSALSSRSLAKIALIKENL